MQISVSKCRKSEIILICKFIKVVCVSVVSVCQQSYDLVTYVVTDNADIVPAEIWYVSWILSCM